MTAAALGATVEVETLDGMEEVDIKPGIQSGEQITLRGLGAGRLRHHGRGDFIVHVEVKTPSKLDAEQVELLRTLAKTRDEVLPAGEHEPLESGFMSKIKDAFTR
jgi:molecular chaperone DnaJ